MKKNMFSIFMAAILTFSLVLPAQAHESYFEVVVMPTVIEVDGYSFVMAESIDEYHRVTRIFERGFIPLGDPNLSEARALLEALGMNENMIALIPDDELAEIAVSPRIYSSVAFMQENDFGAVHYVCGLYAVQQAAYINALKLEQVELAHNYGVMPLHTQHHGHIQVTHIVSLPAIEHGHETLLFTAAATWLNMPFFRNYGSVGSVAWDVAVTSIRSGSYSYVQNVVSGGITTRHHRNGTPTTHWANQGSLAGSAARFRLPANSSAGNIVMFVSDFSVAHSHRAHQRHVGTGFNSRASYVHRTFGFSTPSIGISASGPSIGIGFQTNYNVYHSPLLHITGTQVRPVHNAPYN